MMKKNLLALAITAAVAVPTASSATTVAELEAQMAQMKAQIAEMKAGGGESAGDNFSFGGLVEFAVGEDQDLSIGKVEIGIEGAVAENVTAGVVLLAEHDGTNGVGAGGNNTLAIDEAVISVETEMATITVGKLTVPFGVYETNMISDPLTLDTGETGSDGAIVVEAGLSEGLSMALFTTSDSEDVSGVSVAYEAGDLVVGAGAIQNVLGTAGNDATTFSVSYGMGGVSLIAEAVSTDGDDATNFEVAYDFGNDVSAAVGRTEIDGGEERNMAAINVGLTDGLSLAVEHLDSNDNSADATSAVLAYEF